MSSELLSIFDFKKLARDCDCRVPSSKIDLQMESPVDFTNVGKLQELPKSVALRLLCSFVFLASHKSIASHGVYCSRELVGDN